MKFAASAESRVFVWGRWRDVPRRQAAYDDPGTSYRFAGCTVAAQPWAYAPALAALRETILMRTGFNSNFVLVNLYRNGADCIGWHSDDEADLGPEASILSLSLSLGAERDFQFRSRGPQAGRGAVTLRLGHGSLLEMHHPMNEHFMHRLPRRGGSRPERVGLRLNLTWRRIVGGQ